MSSLFLYAVVTLAAIWLIDKWRKRLAFYEKLRWVNKVPGLPLIGNALEFKDPTKSLTRMQEVLLENDGLCYVELLYRPIILISNYNFVEWLLSSNTLIEKSLDYKFLHNWLEDGILISTGATWKNGRKILSPAFHFSVLEEIVTKFDKPTLILIELLEKEVGKDSVNIYSYIKNYALDVICESSMGIEVEAQKKSQSTYVKSVDSMCNIVVDRAFNPLKTKDWLYMLTPSYYKEKAYVRYLHSMSDKVIKSKKSSRQNGIKEDKDDDTGRKKKNAFLDLLLTYKDQNGEPLSEKFIREQVDTIMFAGHDTTSMGLCFAIHCLSKNREEQEKAFKEIKEISEGKDKFIYADLQEMRYLELIIKETLRLYPTVPFYSRNTSQDFIFQENKVIPKDVTLLTCAYAINRDPKVFKEPEKFIPTRFLDTDVKPFSYLPFSAGPRNCIGQKFAMLEMKATLAKLLLNFEILPSIPEHNVILSAEAVLKSKNGFCVRLKKRTI
nr:Cytochrome P450 [Sitophilus oryzae]